MLVPSIMTLTIATAAACLSINTKEEIVKVAMASTALLSALLTLIFAPWEIKLLIMVIPLVLDKLNNWSIGKNSN